MTTSSALSLLLDLCTRNDILFPEKILAEAKQNLKAAGDEGSRTLAELILELLDSRSRRISWALVAAQEATPTPELLAAVQSVVSAEPLKIGTPQRFPPEIIGDGRIGWTDAAHERITEHASEALEALRKD